MAKISEVISTIEGPEFDRQNVQNLANNVISIWRSYELSSN